MFTHQIKFRGWLIGVSVLVVGLFATEGITEIWGMMRITSIVGMTITSLFC